MDVWYYISPDVWGIIIEYGDFNTYKQLRCTCRTIRRIVDKSDRFFPHIKPCKLIELYEGRVLLGWEMIFQASIVSKVREDYPKPLLIPDGMRRLSLKDIVLKDIAPIVEEYEETEESEYEETEETEDGETEDEESEWDEETEEENGGDEPHDNKVHEIWKSNNDPREDKLCEHETNNGGTLENEICVQEDNIQNDDTYENDYIKIPQSLTSLDLYNVVVNPERLFKDSTSALKSLTITEDYHFISDRCEDKRFDISGWIPLSVTDLTLNGTNYKDDLVCRLTNLKTLSLTRNRYLEGNFLMNGVLKSLESLTFLCDRCKGDHYDRWGYGCRCRLIEKGAMWVKSLPESLTNLCLINVVITNDDQSKMQDCMNLPPRLKNLELWQSDDIKLENLRPPIGPPISLLNGIPETLTTLDITRGDSSTVTDATLSWVLSRTKTLVKLKLEACLGITGTCLVYLSKTVNILNLNHSGLTSHGLRCIPPLTPLHKLRVVCTKIDPDSLIGLIRAGPTKLCRLDISGCFQERFHIIVRSLFEVGIIKNTRFFDGLGYGNGIITGWRNCGVEINEYIKFCLENGLFECETQLHDLVAPIAFHSVENDIGIDDIAFNFVENDIDDITTAIITIRDYLNEHGFYARHNGNVVPRCHLERALHLKLMTRRKMDTRYIQRIKILQSVFGIQVNQNHMREARESVRSNRGVLRYLRAEVSNSFVSQDNGLPLPSPLSVDARKRKLELEENTPNKHAKGENASTI